MPSKRASLILGPARTFSFLAVTRIWLPLDVAPAGQLYAGVASAVFVGGSGMDPSNISRQMAPVVYRKMRILVPFLTGRLSIAGAESNDGIAEASVSGSVGWCIPFAV